MKRTELLHIFEMVLLCALGLTLVLYPEKSWTTALKILGIALIAGGAIAALYYFFFLRVRSTAPQEDMIIGIAGCVCVVVGAVVLIAPKLFTEMFRFVAGILVAFSGILNLIKALNVKRSGGKEWIVLMILSLLTIALGVLIFIDPFNKQPMLVILVGAVLIYNGILGIVTAIRD